MRTHHWTSNLATIGSRMKVERQRLRVSFQHAAYEGGVKRYVLSAWENGIGQPSVQYLAALAEHGADIHFIVTGQSYPRSAWGEQFIDEATARRAFWQLLPQARRRLVLELLAAELRH